MSSAHTRFTRRDVDLSLAWPPQYEMVKENETIEARHERAKIIVDMELLWPKGMWFLGPHKYGTYLHILTNKHSGAQLLFTSCGTQVLKFNWR